MTQAPAGARHLYIHVPFCTRRCSYCDFSIAVRRDVPVSDYLRAVASEFAVRNLRGQVEQLDTVYLGGGTPSRLGAAGIAELLDIVRTHGTISADAEITVEANPEDFTPEAVDAWRKAGVNRLSIGVQSFDDHVLKWMHRVHDANAARRALHLARDGGLTDCSLDLIFALPAALGRDWQRDLDEALALEPEHVSLYGLTIEQGTPVGRWHGRGDLLEAPDEGYEAEFLAAHATLTRAGFEHYEVSNFSRPRRRARHNSAYWTGVPYLGVGPAAHGFDGQRRRWNIKGYVQWSAALGRGADPLGGDELLSPENRIAESVYLGLRTTDGLVVDSPGELRRIEPWIRAGWVQAINHSADGAISRIRCTPLGWLRLDALAADLTAIRSHS